MISSALIALGKEGSDFYSAFSKFLKFVLYIGYRVQELVGTYNPSEALLKANEEVGDKQPAPMVAVIGYSQKELEDRVKQTNDSLGLSGSEAIYVSLYNTPDSNIVSGNPESLLEFRKKFKSEMDEKK